QGYVQFLAVMKYATMVVRKTARAHIQIKPLVKVADLFGLGSVFVHLFDHRAAPRRMISSTGALGQFDNFAAVVCARKFIGSGQPGNTSAKDDYRFARS